MAEGTRLTKFKTASYEYQFRFVQDWRDNFTDLVPATTRFAGMSGGFDEYGTAPAPASIGMVQVNFSIPVELKSQMTSELETLRAMSRLGKGRLFYQPADASKDELWCEARLNNLQTSHNLNTHTDLIMKSQATFQVSDPHWYAQGTWPPAWGSGIIWGNFDWGGGAAPATCNGTHTDISVSREGNAPVRPRILVSIPSGQSAEDVVIQVLGGGALAAHEVRYTGVLSAGDTLDVNAWAMRVRLNGSDAFTTDFTYKTIQWIELPAGVSTVRVKMKNASDQCEVIIRYYEAYV